MESHIKMNGAAPFYRARLDSVAINILYRAEFGEFVQRVPSSESET